MTANSQKQLHEGLETFKYCDVCFARIYHFYVKQPGMEYTSKNLKEISEYMSKFTNYSDIDTLIFESITRKYI